MNRLMYNVIKSFLGVRTRQKIDIFYMMPREHFADYMNDVKYEPIRKWVSDNPNEVLSVKKAKEILKKDP